ncbi:VWA domain-containing protein [Patulibacter defluvii]|uniref:VWA domain-containing protein n=1 Tax=Patulibacter defluvii TaxID=3095358 RepID=UPI002A7550DA|nr:VWA domain-containing protein [Patulibacter sp. DM4]
MPTVRFPFTALVGQDDLRRALLINAVAPEVGGVLVRGERGTAKTTAVRALEGLLPAVDVVAGCPYGSAPAEADRCPCPACAALVADGRQARARAGAPISGSERRPAPLVELPVGATVDRVVGTLDLERALQEGEAVLQPGLLARAHRGILYVDEVNLLGDHLVDVLLDAAAQGEAVVERDNVSVRHPARFLLVGTMNPEEGDLRPQLLDRFGLSVTVAGSTDPAVRAEVVRRRLAFEADPEAFAARFRDDEAAVARTILDAVALLPRVTLGERMLRLITGACARLQVDGLRADLVASRCARALAALDGRDEVTDEDVRQALLLTLPHRRRRGPLDPPGLEPEELDGALDEARDDEPPPVAGGPGDDPDGGPDDEDGPGPGSGGPASPPPAGSDAPPPSSSAAPDRGCPAASAPPSSDDRPEPAAAPEADDGGPGPTAERPPSGAPAGDRPFDPSARARERTDAPGGAAGLAPLLELARGGGGVAGRRGRTSGAHGHPVDVRPRETAEEPLAVPATLRAAAIRGATTAGVGHDRDRGERSRLAVASQDHRTPIRAGREGTLVTFCVDASGSMGARKRMAAVKDAALGLLLDAYQRRDRVALVTFRGSRAEVVLPPTGSVERAAVRLAQLPTGGGTPLAAGLDAAATLVAAHRRRDPQRRSLCVVVTDGRASGGKAGLAAAERAAERLGQVADGVVVFDSEQGRVRLGLSRRIADRAGARLLPVGVLTGEPLAAGRARPAGAPR